MPSLSQPAKVLSVVNYNKNPTATWNQEEGVTVVNIFKDQNLGGTKPDLPHADCLPVLHGAWGSTESHANYALLGMWRELTADPISHLEFWAFVPGWMLILRNSK